MSGVKLSVITDGISHRLEKVLDVVEEHKLDQIEIQHLWHKQIHELSKSEIGYAGDLISDRGVSVCCITGHAFHGLAIADAYNDPQLLQGEFDKLKASLEVAAALDCDKVRIMNFKKEMFLFGDGGAEAWNVRLELWDHLLSVFATACAMARSAGVGLLVETGLNSMISTAALGRRLLDELNATNIKILWDPANCLYYAEQPVSDGFDVLGVQRVGHVHIKDVRLDVAGASISHCALGEGDLGPSVDALAERLRQTEYEGVVSLESVYKPQGGSFEDGFRQSIGKFTAAFG